MKIKINLIKPNIKNPRKRYDKGELEELKLSLQSMGQLNPCIVDEKYILLSGHRRHFAAKELGWKELDCIVKKGLSTFEKSAILVSANSTQISFNAWESREAISRIYWDEFLEEYHPRSSKDKGYSTFSNKMGLSITHIRKIVESTKKENKSYYERLKAANCSPNTVDEVMSAPKHLRTYLTDAAIKRKEEIKDMGSDRTRDYIRAEKRKAQLLEKDNIHTSKFRVWIDRIEALNFEFDEVIIEKGDWDDLKKLKKSLKPLAKFYNKLEKALNK